MPAIRVGDVLAYEFDVAPKWFFEGTPPSAPVRQRSFVLIEDQIQLCQPVVNRRAHDGWWYVELVRVDDRGDHVLVADDFIDVMVGPPDHPYRILDLDEFADAVAADLVTPERLIEGLGLFQRFLDRHLNRRDDAVREWPDFPPRAMAALREAPIPDPHGWAANTVD